MRLPTDGEHKKDFNDALPVLMIVPVNEAKEAKKIDEIHYIVKEALNTSAPGLLTVSHISTTPFMERTIAMFVANCLRTRFVNNSHQLSKPQVPITSKITMNSYFAVALSTTDTKVVPRSLQAHLLQAYHYQ